MGHDATTDFSTWQILQILVKAVVENLTDSQGNQAGALQSKLKELLGRVSSRHSSDAEVWRQYGLLYGDGHSAEVEDNQKVGAALAYMDQITGRVQRLGCRTALHVAYESSVSKFSCLRISF